MNESGKATSSETANAANQYEGKLLVEIVGGRAPRYIIEFADPRQAFCDTHNSRCPDGSVARVIHSPGPRDVPDLSFVSRKSG